MLKRNILAFIWGMVACTPTSGGCVAVQTVEEVGGGQGNSAKNREQNNNSEETRKQGMPQLSFCHLAVF